MVTGVLFIYYCIISKIIFFIFTPPNTTNTPTYAIIQNMNLLDISYVLGSKISNNSEVEKLYNLQEGFILEKTNIKERRYFDTDQNPIEIGADIINTLLQNHNLEKEQIVRIYGSSNFYSEEMVPSDTHRIVQKAGFENVAIRSTNYGCAGYLAAFQDMCDFINRAEEEVFCIFVLSDHISKMCNTYNTAVLFSDAVCVSIWTNSKKYENNPKVDTVYYNNLVEHTNAVNLKNNFWFMNGGEISKMVKKIPAIIQEKMKIDFTKYTIIPHQANPKLLETVENLYNIKLYKEDCASFGNTSVPALFIAIANNLKKDKQSKNFLCLDFGDTGSYGAFVIQR